MLRNNFVDVIRGIAMLLVVLGHTMSGCTAAFKCSALFQVIWTLQMPLFIIISGYVTRYSRPLTTWKQLGNLIRKRSLAYLLPWSVWTFFVKGLLFNHSEFLNLKYLTWHMDSGYWFLVTIWLYMVSPISQATGLYRKINTEILCLISHFACWECVGSELSAISPDCRFWASN